MTSRIALLQAQLEAAYRSSRWHSFTKALDGVGTEEAVWKPAHYKGFPWMSGSILDIVFHVARDTLYQHDYAFGPGTMTWEKLTALFDAEGKDLQTARAMADKGFQELQSTLKTLIDDDLSRRAPTPERAKTQTLLDFYQMIHEHYLYHAGQIMYVRSLRAGLIRIAR